jgi:hypothetical protein
MLVSHELAIASMRKNVNFVYKYNFTPLAQDDRIEPSVLMGSCHLIDDVMATPNFKELLYFVSTKLLWLSVSFKKAIL